MAECPHALIELRQRNSERTGFEPAVNYSPTPGYQSGTLSRSVTSPSSDRNPIKNSLIPD